ncbi:hypothetical protein FA95DRAFT_1257354 [Auriscalpium vulgare]|uniref:Uncharacterized protein n=1 Tax=Auriscalpium vulgare TaxID=40419 RepID=A0ACB8S881_9AGAM|nr:hypothetical protein FA95DRAFT_1257354 [Auriscalpium vulgare]
MLRSPPMPAAPRTDASYATPASAEAPVRTKSSVPHAHAPADPLPSPHPPTRRRIPAAAFARPQTASSVSLGRGSGSKVARSLCPPPEPIDIRGRAAADASIPNLREALSSLDSKMANLMSERERIESRLAQAVRLQAPIQRLPSELLASIFTIGVLDMDEEDPLMLSSMMLVCRYWADVAASTPVLWSRVVVSNHDSLDKAKRRLSRSKSVPLDVCISFSPQMEQGGSTTETIVHAMDILWPSIWRWRSFQLSVPNRPQAHAALSRCREKAPLLEVLQVRVFHSMQDDQYHTKPPLPLFDAHTPRLTVCSFNSFNFGWDVSTIRGLRVLELGGYWNSFAPSVTVILDILRACPTLEELSLRNMSDVDPETCLMYDHEPHHDKRYPTHIIHLPRLVKASFYYAGIQRTRTILSQLTFPALEKIELCYMDNVTPVLHHLKRQSLTSLPLRHLRVEASFFNELELVKFLGRVSSLTTLELVDVEDASSNLLKGLSAPSVTQSWICPKLETLSLDGCTTLDWDALRSFVESRLPAHARAYPRQAVPPMISLPAPASYSSLSLRQPHPSSIAAIAHHPSHGRSHSAPPNTSVPFAWPQRLKAIDLTRCHQISKEAIQWLRLYVAEVKCDAVRGPWRESSFS